MSIKLKSSGYNYIHNQYKLPILYKLYVQMPTNTMNNRMNKRSQLSNLTRLALQTLGNGNTIVMNLKPANKINTIKKAINKVTKPNRAKAARLIQNYFRTRREMRAFGNTNRGKSITNNKLPKIEGLLRAFRRKQRV